MCLLHLELISLWRMIKHQNAPPYISATIYEEDIENWSLSFSDDYTYCPFEWTANIRRPKELPVED